LHTTAPHWRCGGIHCLFSPEPMMSKNTKVHCLFYSPALSSAETEAE